LIAGSIARKTKGWKYTVGVPQKLDYKHYDPVVAGIVEKPEDYLYSSARAYWGMPGLIDIMPVEPLVQ
jgi:putative transposase